MASRYRCLCGFGSNDPGVFKGHLMAAAQYDGKDKHKSLTPSKATQSRQRKAQTPPVEAVAPADLEAVVPGPGLIAAALAEEENIISKVGARTATTAVVEPPQPKAPKSKEPKQPKEKLPAKDGPKNKTDLLKFLMIAGGCFLGVLGIGIGVKGNETHNMAILAGALLAIVGGGISVWRGFMRGRAGVDVVELQTQGETIKDNKGKPILVKPNSLNWTLDGIAFEHTDNPPGLLWKYRQDSKEYHVNIANKETGQLQRFVLPDTVHISPQLAAIPLYMPASRRLFRRRKESLLKQLTPWAIVVAMLILAFIWAIMTPPPKDKTVATPTTEYTGRSLT